MLENNFVYISAVISLFAILYVVGKVFLILHMRDNFDSSHTYHIVTLSLGGVYEIITIVLMCVLIKNVILNVYCYLFLADAIMVFIAALVYYLHYRMFVRRKLRRENVAEEETKENAQNDENVSNA